LAAVVATIAVTAATTPVVIAPAGRPISTAVTVVAPPIAILTALTVIAPTTAPVAVATFAAFAPGTSLDDRDELFVVAKDLEAVIAVTAFTAGQHLHDLDAVQALLNFNFQHRTNSNIAGKGASSDHAAGVFGSCCTPGPTAVIAGAGDLDVDPSGHGSKR